MITGSGRTVVRGEAGADASHLRWLARKLLLGHGRLDSSLNLRDARTWRAAYDAAGPDVESLPAST
jgi:hypothetical protein